MWRLMSDKSGAYASLCERRVANKVFKRALGGAEYPLSLWINGVTPNCHQWCLTMMFTRTLPFPQPHVRSRGSWLNGSEFRHSTQRHRSNGHRKGEHRTGLPDPDHRVALQAHWVCVEVCFKVICGLPHRFCLSDGLRKFFYAFLASLHRFFSFPFFMVGTIYHVMRTISATITRTRIKLNTQIHPKLLFSTFCQPPRSSLIVVPKPGVSWMWVPCFSSFN